MTTRIVVRNPSMLAVVGLVLVLMLARAPTEIAHLRDRFAGFSGTIVEKGADSHVLGIFGPLWDPYLVIQDSSGHRERRWVTRSEHALAEVGTYVEKPKGYAPRGEWKLWVKRPGQLNQFQLIDSLQALKTAKDKARRDSLIAHIRR